jgi:hypothetical protein
VKQLDPAERRASGEKRCDDDDDDDVMGFLQVEVQQKSTKAPICMSQGQYK